ncbi:hypothetical protein BKD30_06510 [Tersicoccus phoenicis]|uniref:Wadjet protein JetD C-terminal domain-containing protein n=1 Tax=Tersicoccus phoenicis TaxID=554083 RepID=A0A1R1LCF6_9MICC|nr:Wadjet anti-phage system protein JetD domain-containing protein [Tersicoccus phoenicis]OMH25195.1 hypothetical protein BKD30_06510 [Tersicoccus phoenicis]
MPGSSAWTRVSDLQALARRSWDRGELLREAIRPTGVHPRRRALKRPTAAQLRDEYAAVRAWAADRHASHPFALETAEVGRTTIGTNLVPSAAVFGSAADEAAFAGRRREFDRFRRLADVVLAAEPELEPWMLRRPLAALDLDDALPDLVRAARWFADHPAPGIYLRQLALPGIHTKLLEQHRRVLDELISTLDPARAAGGFEARHGLLTQDPPVRFRLLDPALAFPGGATDVVLRVADFARLELDVDTVIVVENKVTFLALPPVARAVAVWGAGFGSHTRVPGWVRDARVLYWGDLDSPGFAVLDQLRATHPHVVSVLMDSATLEAHRELCVREPKPTRASLAHLTSEEALVYASLAGARLEQEYVRWDWAVSRQMAAVGQRER